MLQRPSEGTLTTQDSRNEPDYPLPIHEERTFHVPPVSSNESSPLVTHAESVTDVLGGSHSGSQSSTSCTQII